jgi:phosphoglycolate phosphatase
VLDWVVRLARCLLIDFDGPICSVFAGRPASAVAAELRAVIGPGFDGVNDPLRLLVEVAALGDDRLTREVADACRDAEVAAVRSAAPTPGADEAMRSARATGHLVAIVSNNAADAVESYLRDHDLLRYIDGLAARVDGLNPRLLKPNPFLLERGLTAAGGDKAAAVFVGDSVTDVEAGRAAGIPTIGYANKPGKRDRLTGAGADLVIETMGALSGVLREWARPA